MRCFKCGGDNPAGKKFCGDCAAQLANRCHKCGADNPLAKQFCGDCGSSLSAADDGLDLVVQGLSTAERTGQTMAEAELTRVKGELLMIKDPCNVAEVERCLCTAIEVARRQRTKLFELRGTTSLARLLTNHGRREQARAILAEIYNWFTEGFDTADLKDAKALLDDLAAQ